jgi:hypothetical protein
MQAGSATEVQMSLSSHQRPEGRSDEWLTPPEILKVLGPFDLDPCAPVERLWDTAASHYTIEDDGLSQPWHGRVWLNPPFNRYQVARWLRRLAQHGSGIALLPARTETAMFYESVWPHACAVLFMKGRPHFHVAKDTVFNIKGKPPILVRAGGRAPLNSGAPICLVAYGGADKKALYDSNLGVVIQMSHMIALKMPCMSRCVIT